MKKLKSTFSMAAVLTASVFVGSVSSPAEAKPEVNDQLLATGKAAYMRECSACHGVEGDGQGPGAHYLNPRPRDFSLGVYKLRSTPNGEIPTDEDLFRTITIGIPNSMMPSFKSLSQNERWALVETIKRMGGIEEETSKSVVIPAASKTSPEAVVNGEKLYVKLKCATCHGTDGHGEGPSSLSLKNDAKERIYPSDLTTGVFKGGADAKDLYTRIATGMDGSPMPSYVAEATPAEIWDLVHYIKNLSVKK